MKPILSALMLIASSSLLTTAGCTKVYYAGLEKVGIPKRDLLQKRVERAQESQKEVKEQFSSALERFRATVRVEGGELEERYDALKDELAASERRADQLGERIASVEDVAEALFDEWEDELDDYHRSDLRAASARNLEDTKRAYAPMIRAMKRADERAEPVLDAFRDVVLAMKHQLNAKAIAGIQRELANVESEVNALIAAMNSSIAEAGKFLGTLERDAGGKK